MDKKHDKRDLQKDLKEVFLLRRDIREDLDTAAGFLSNYYEKKRNRTIRMVSIIAASAAILVICIWSLGPSLITIDSNQLYSEFYSRFDPDVFTRDLDDMTELDKGIVAYKTGRNDQALEAFNKLEIDNTQTLMFYKSLALLDECQYEEANQIMEDLSKQGDFMLSEVYWYLTLINLRKEDYGAARDYLRILKQTDPKAHKQDIRKIKRRIRIR